MVLSIPTRKNNNNNNTLQSLYAWLTCELAWAQRRYLGRCRGRASRTRQWFAPGSGSRGTMQDGRWWV